MPLGRVPVKRSRAAGEMSDRDSWIRIGCLHRWQINGTPLIPFDSAAIPQRHTAIRISDQGRRLESIKVDPRTAGCLQRKRMGQSDALGFSKLGDFQQQNSYTQIFYIQHMSQSYALGILKLGDFEQHNS